MPPPSQISLPGRLGNPSMKFYQDPRAHPKLISALAAFGADGSRPDIFANMTFEDVSSDDFIGRSERATMKIYDLLPLDLPSDSSDPEIEETTRTFRSFDGAERKLYIFRRKDLKSEVLPAVIYSHGGGMVTGHTANQVHFRWCRSMAVKGVVAIAVDFRNAYTPQGRNPFPAGLKDCVAGFKEIDARKGELGIGKIVLQGESGGANLAIATALIAKREGWVERIAGVFGMVPFISGGYGWPEERILKELPSLYENDGYFLSCKAMAGTAHVYAPEDETNPLAWPYFASVEECRGLPPHRITVDELDPLRDEGMAFYRKLLAAEVDVTAHVNLGVVHATSLIFRQLLPEVYNEAITQITDFAKSL